METVYKRRRHALSLLKERIKDSNSTLIIHYSYASFQNENDEISPMITAIVVKSLDGNIYEHFGIHIEADLINCTKQEIKDYYPELELSMLEKYKDFLKMHQDTFWIHWDMVNINYGFQAIKHRYIRLAGELKGRDFYEVPSHKKVNLDSIIQQMYGDNYAPNPDKLHDLLLINNVKNQNKYLSLSQEENEFAKLNFKSVYDSVDFKTNLLLKFTKVLERKKLKIPNKNRYSNFLDIISHPLFHFIGWIATLLGTYLAFK